MEIKDHRFLITGGAGLMGSHITDRLLAKGASEIILLDNFVRGSMHNIESALKDRRVRLVKGDIQVHRALLQSPVPEFEARESLASGVCPAVVPSAVGGMRLQLMASTIDARAQSI